MLAASLRIWSLYGKDKIREVAARAVETERAEVDRERLLTAPDARLDDEEEGFALAREQIALAIIQVCDDLGLDPDWSL